jgi:hypothetical protein
MASYIGTEGARREPHRRRQWIDDWLNTKARGSSSRSKRPARLRPDVFAGNVEIGVAEKEALPRSRAALHLGQAGWGDSKPAGFELRRLRHGGDVDGEFGKSGPPRQITDRPPRNFRGGPPRRAIVKRARSGGGLRFGGVLRPRFFYDCREALECCLVRLFDSLFGRAGGGNLLNRFVVVLKRHCGLGIISALPVFADGDGCERPYAAAWMFICGEL